MATSHFSSATVVDGTSVNSIVDLSAVVTLIQTVGADTYFDATAKIGRVDTLYTHSDGRQFKQISHKLPSFKSGVIWSATARDGAWSKTWVKAYDKEGAVSVIPGSAISGENLTHASGAMTLNT